MARAWSFIRILSVTLAGCGGTEAPAPLSVVDAVPGPSTDPVVVPLEPIPSVGGATFGGWSLEELKLSESDVAHPEPSATMSFFPLRYGLRRLVIGFDQGPDGWVTSADLNGDGALSESERVTLVVDASGHSVGTLEGSVVRGEVTLAVPIQVSIESTDGRNRFSLSIERKRRGVLPGDVAVVVRSRGGIFDHPQARVIVDENGDGEADLENRLVSFHLEEGVIGARGRHWAVSLPPDGSALTVTPTDAPLVGMRIGRPAPPFSVVASDGETHELARYAGAPLLLDFWATWCAPCIALHPEVEALAGRHELAVLGISANETQAEVDRWLKKNPTPWPSAAIGPKGAVNEAYDISGWPAHALIDAEGRLVVVGSFLAVRRALGEAI